jgi:5-methylcytosine-specific restriction endonuclease McrA
LLATTAGPCPLCRRPILPLERVNVDHIVPRADGGTDALENLQRVHQRCNMAKNARCSTKLREKLQSAPERGRRRRRVWEGAIRFDARS